eukprot:1755860-Pyramimonas_sp.AAC.1
MPGYTWDKHSNIVNALASDMNPLFPGRRFPARVGHAGPAFRHPPASKSCRRFYSMTPAATPGRQIP